MLEKFSHITREELLDYEFSILFLINYDMYVYCPYKALIGLSNMIQVVYLTLTIVQSAKGFEDINSELDKKNLCFSYIEKQCSNLIDQSFKTDLIFLYSYSEIAFTVMHIVLEKELNFNMEKMLSMLEFQVTNELIENFEKIKRILSDKSLNKEVEINKIQNYVKAYKNLKKNEEYQKSHNNKKKY